MSLLRRKNALVKPPPTHPHAELVEAICTVCGKLRRGVIGNPQGDRSEVVFEDHVEVIVRPGNARPVRCDGSGTHIKKLRSVPR